MYIKIERELVIRNYLHRKVREVALNSLLDYQLTVNEINKKSKFTLDHKGSSLLKYLYYHNPNICIKTSFTSCGASCACQLRSNYNETTEYP